MIVPIIPSLNPDDKLIRLVDELKQNFNDIIIVNDGSVSDEIFQKIKIDKKVHLLTHEVNKGKGEALKTAFRYYLEHFVNKYSGVITLDADGQHLVSDVIKIEKVVDEKDTFVLGTRLFNTKEVPWRNKIGNKITSKIFKKFYGVYLKDTQTGLRGIPNRLIKDMLIIEGSRFEYEMNMLIYLVKNNETIQELDITTVYLNDSNKKSHFKVWKDSYKIYQIMFKKRKNCQAQK